MKRYIKGFMLGAALLIVFIAPAYAGPVTTNYMGGAVSVGGYMINPGYVASLPYMVGAQSWTVALKPAMPLNVGSANVQPFQPGGIPLSDYQVIVNAFPGATGWTFPLSGALPNNSLVVRTYEAYDSGGSDGAQFVVQYTGNPPANNLHWIQVVSDNYNITNPIPGLQGPGKNELVVDNPFSPGGRSPYYDDGGAASSGMTPIALYDLPTRPDNVATTWEADLFLVSGPAAGSPGPVTIYGGVEWGWNNYPAPVPLPSALLLFAPALAGIGVLRRRFNI